MNFWLPKVNLEKRINWESRLTYTHRAVLCAQSLQSYPTLCKLTRLLCPCDSPGKNTRAGCLALLLGIFRTQGSHPHWHFLHCRLILYHRATRKPHIHTAMFKIDKQGPTLQHRELSSIFCNNLDGGKMKQIYVYGITLLCS